MNTFEATNFVALSNEELMGTDGGVILTATIAGVAVWKVGLGVAAAFGVGAGLGYYANRP